MTTINQDQILMQEMYNGQRIQIYCGQEPDVLLFAVNNLPITVIALSAKNEHFVAALADAIGAIKSIIDSI